MASIKDIEVPVTVKSLDGYSFENHVDGKTFLVKATTGLPVTVKDVKFDFGSVVETGLAEGFKNLFNGTFTLTMKVNGANDAFKAFSEAMEALPQPVLTPEEEEAAYVERAKRRVGVLMFVNTVRLDFGLPPLDGLSKGMVGKPEDCVIARSIMEGAPSLWVSTGMGATWVEVRAAGSWTRRKYDHTDEIERFVHDFDAKLYPNLLA